MLYAGYEEDGFPKLGGQEFKPNWRESQDHISPEFKDMREYYVRFKKEILMSAAICPQTFWLADTCSNANRCWCANGSITAGCL
jgi:hypothetical protein